MESSKIMMFPEMGNSNSIDPALLLALNNNGGFGGNNWIWILFLWLMWGGAWGNGGFGGGLGNNGAAGFLSNQLSNDTGRELLMNAIQGNRDSINSLANLLNTEVNTVQNGIFTLNNAINSVGTQVGMSGLQIQNAIQSGNANIASQICQCCCENRLAIANQTSALQAQMAANNAATQLQFAQGQAADQLAMCQLTNTLQSLAERNTRDITDAISRQSVMISNKFCDLKERELQNKIDALTADNALLRSTAATTAQTAQITSLFNKLENEIAAIKAAQPATITLPNNSWTAVPTLVANAGADFISSYWANRLSAATTPETAA